MLIYFFLLLLLFLREHSAIFNMTTATTKLVVWIISSQASFGTEQNFDQEKNVQAAIVRYIDFKFSHLTHRKLEHIYMCFADRQIYSCINWVLMTVEFKGNKKAHRWSNRLWKAISSYLLYLLDSFWNRHLILSFFSCWQQKIRLYTPDKTRQGIFSRFCFLLGVEKTAAHHYDIICVMILLFMAPHFAARSISSMRPISPLSLSSRPFILVKLSFLRFYPSVFRVRPKINTRIKCARTWM